MKLNKKNKYDAQGFVEALIAILITGIGAVVFMTIAARTIADVIHNEQVDRLTQEAIKGSTIVSNIVEEWNFGNRDYINGSDFLVAGSGFSASEGKCYGLDGEINAPVVSIASVCTLDPNGLGVIPRDCIGSASNWDEVVVDATSAGEVEDMFRFVCVDHESEESTMVMSVRIYTGFKSCETITTPVREVSDTDISCDMYEYIAVYKLEPIAPSP